MKTCSLPRIVLLCSAFCATTSYAIEMGHLRGLQKGAIGDSPQFHEFGKYEAEAAARVYRTFGTELTGSVSDTKVSGALFKTTIAAGGGMAPSNDFSLSGFVDFTLASDFDTERKRLDPEVTLDTGPYRHEVAGFGVFKGKGFMAGAGLGLLIIGSEDREFSYKTTENAEPYLSEVSSAALPTIRIFGGLNTKEVQATLGVRFFSQGNAVVEAQDPTGETYEYDVARRNPGEIHIDSRLLLGKQAALAGSFAYVLTGQASESVDEFSMTFTGEGTLKERQTGNDRRNTDHIRVGAGGEFMPAKGVSILGGLTYTSASYKEPQYASLEHENLGGLRIDVGGDVTVQKFRGFLHAGYTIDESVSYEVEDDSRSEAKIQQSQRTPQSLGEKIKVQQGSWELVIGGGMAL